MLKELNLLPVYDSAEQDLIQDLIVPLLENSQEYLRGVGFFTSGWLRIAAAGIVHLVESGGKARFVVSPLLEKKDWEALQMGEEAKHDEWLKQILEKDIQSLADTLEKDTRHALAWMVADNVLEFRFAIPREWSSGGDYHDKVGVFTDSEGNRVAIHGSFNDTIKGSLNGEAFSVFKSWESGQASYEQIHTKRLTKLFYYGNQQFKIYTIPEAARRAFIKLRESSTRPYALPQESAVLLPGSRKDTRPPVKLHPYQEEAIQAWIKVNCQGIFEMATGTGKTFTSLAAAMNRVKALGRLTLIILVPYLHLLDQWREDCEKFGFFPILCSGEHQGWNLEVLSKIQDFNIGAVKTLCLLAVHDTAASEKFKKATRHISSEYAMLIGDEVHALGSPSMQQALLPQASMRLGLSATPRRWFDEVGTAALFAYFGQVCFEFPLEKAIGPYLTPYMYYPQPIHLILDELGEYQELSSRISLLIRQTDDKKAEQRNVLEKLLIKRARILASAEEKLPQLLTLLRRKIREHAQQEEEIRNTLIYCAPGSHKDVLKAVAQLEIQRHGFEYSAGARIKSEKVHLEENDGNWYDV